MFDMKGRTILYTGGAGGLGLETTMHFLDAGARVIVIDRDKAKMAALSEAAEAHHAERLLIREFDLADLDGLRNELAEIQATFGGIDVVINNAAIYPSKPFHEFTVEEHQAVQRVNVDAAIVCVQAALPHMRKNQWGRIINIASITVYGGWALLAPYVQSKGALIGLARAWAREYGPDGITANAVSPGAFPTDAEKIHPDPEGYTKFVLDHQSVKYRGEPADIANALMFFASDGSRFVTGQTLNVDGGWVMH
ncbi:SDR family oxidoreductase [Rhizobium sp. KVB221]|uniref:SDR family oxidoreductase n=1 Tax=Rhizobium setariae TaxID=2801340 RepID=A0A937CMI9_9HYPH|nr:SDR family oxidoreductase [Rhizobium setariae]MBL0372786.1 SDR family oxidoreductase [Rhizobium setariae]